MSCPDRQLFSKGQPLYSYFFHEDDNQSLRTVTMAITTISTIFDDLVVRAQTGYTSPYQKALSAVLRLKRVYQGGAFDLANKNFGGLWELLREIFGLLERGTCFLVVDAWDEADRSRRSLKASWPRLL